MLIDRIQFDKYKKLASYGKKYKRTISLMLACGALLTVLQVAIPFLIGRAVTIILGSGNPTQQVLVISLEIVGLSAASSLFQFGLGYGGQYLGQRVIYDMRNRIFAAIQGQSFSFHDKNQTGQLMARATGDVEAVRRFLAFGSAQLLGQVLLMAGVLIGLWLLNIELALIVTLALPILIYVSWRFSQTQAPFWKRARLNYGNINTVLQENITGMKIVRAFSAEQKEIDKFNKVNTEYRDDIIGASRIRALYTPLLTLIITLTLASLYLVAGAESHFVPSLNSAELAGTITSAAFLVGLLQGPVRFLGQLILIFQNGMAGFERIVEITDASVEVVDRPSAMDLNREEIKGNIAFQGVRFGYGKGNEILKGVDLEIKPGEIVAFLGATGSGKTTLANLVPRFYDVTEGQVLIDGKDVREIKLKSLRSNIGIVSQDIFLFSATVRANISYGKWKTPLEQVVKAARIANVDEFVEKLPEKYETLVGERGITLSGGQKQRIAIARTLITDPKILILDDSLSSVDVETEYSIQDALKTVVANRTTIMITQRLSTLRLATRIVVFQDGKIVEQGTHDKLLLENGVYSKLYYSQLSPQLTEGQSGTTSIFAKGDS
ncbi:MAG: ABC transporter ATP-binding protein [Nitrososphaerota archaeon]|nr:ABC transporter ATP-binding protein [Nitrososphaerota archaeon]